MTLPAIMLEVCKHLLREARQRMGLHPIWGARAEPCDGVYDGMEP